MHTFYGFSLMVYQGGFPDNGEIVNFTVEDEPKWVKVKLGDGSEIANI